MRESMKKLPASVFNFTVSGTDLDVYWAVDEAPAGQEVSLIFKISDGELGAEVPLSRRQILEMGGWLSCIGGMDSLWNPETGGKVADQVFSEGGADI
jgi:hypothetical protein